MLLDDLVTSVVTCDVVVEWGTSRFLGAPSVQKSKTYGFFGRGFVLLRKSELWGGGEAR